MKNQIIIDRETGEKLKRFHELIEEYILELNKKFSLNYYEMIGVLETIIWGLHDDAFCGEEVEEE
jgi:hypothetical protein